MSELFHEMRMGEQLDTCIQFHKHFTSVNYDRKENKKSCAIVQYFQNAPAYFISAVSYAHKMFIQFIPGINV
jgi:hypothetical protein